jgi:predicted CxxxxCH...CXXCH cytochrome family protein
MQNPHRGLLKSLLARGLAIALLSALPFFSLMTSGAIADQTCSDCHNTATQHGGACSADTGNCAACHGNPPVDAAGLIHPYADEPRPAPSGSTSAGAHAKHATPSGMNYACSTCHFGGMSITSERLIGLPPDGSYNGNGLLQIGFNIPVQGGVSFLTGGTYSGVTGLTYPYDATNGTVAATGGTRTCSNIYCHSDGTYVSTGALPFRTSPAWDTTSVPLTCDTCHGYPPSYATGSPKANSHMAAGHQHACNFCHAATTADGHTISGPPNRANHANGIYNVAADPAAQFNGVAVTLNYSYDAGGGTCSNVSCHGGIGAIAWGVLPNASNCTICHTGIVQSGTGQNHHSAACTDCHGTTLWPLHQGATPPGCTSCHTESLTSMRHPYTQTATIHAPSSCETCHAYRVGSVTYSYAGVKPTDYDHICGQCHGGSAGQGATTNGAPYFDAIQLTAYAIGIHNNDTLNADFSLAYGGNNATAVVQASATGISCDYDWGDNTAHGTTCASTHTYTTGGEKLITLHATSGANSGSRAKVFTAVIPTPPIASTDTATILDSSSWIATLHDTSTAVAPNTLVVITVAWGDGTVVAQAPGTTFTHNYTTTGSFIITQTAQDSAGQMASARYSVTVSNPQIVGNVYKHDGVTGIGGAYVYVTRTANGKTNTYMTATASTGSFSFSNLSPGTFSNLRVTKSGYTFPAIASPATDGTPNIFIAN